MGNLCACRVGRVPRFQIRYSGDDRPWDQPTPLQPLQDAAFKGDLSAVAALLDEGADANELQDGTSALHYAACHGHSDMVAALLAAGAHPDSPRPSDGVTPLQFAVYTEDNCRGRLVLPPGCVQVVKMLCDAGADVNAASSAEYIWDTPIVMAAKVGDADIVRALLTAGADPSRSVHHRTALHVAGSGAVVRALMAGGADVDATSYDKNTALHTAANGDVTRALLAAGADTMALNFNDHTPLDAALGSGYSLDAPRPSVVEVLLATLDDADRADKAMEALEAAVKFDDGDLAKVALAAGADVADAWPSVLGNAQGSLEEVVPILLASGVDVSALHDGQGALAHLLDAEVDEPEALDDTVRLLLNAGVPLTGASAAALQRVALLWRKDLAELRKCKHELETMERMPVALREAIVGLEGTVRAGRGRARGGGES